MSGHALVDLFVDVPNLGLNLFSDLLFETFENLVAHLLFNFVDNLGLNFNTHLFLNGFSTIDLYLDGNPERTIDAAQPADLLDPGNMEHLDQPLFLLGHGVENPADGIHGHEEYLYIVELPTQNPFEEPTEWTVKVSGHSAFPRWDGPTDEAFERASWQFEGALSTSIDGLLAESHARPTKSY